MNSAPLGLTRNFCDLSGHYEYSHLLIPKEIFVFVRNMHKMCLSYVYDKINIDSADGSISII